MALYGPARAYQAVDCGYQVPPGSTDSRVFNLRNLVVTYTPSGGPPRVLTQAPDSSCQSGQWYAAAVDSNGNPTELTLCPDTCAAASGDPGRRIEVTFSCLTIGY